MAQEELTPREVLARVRRTPGMTEQSLILLEHEQEVLDLVLHGLVAADEHIALVRAFHAGAVSDLQLARAMSRPTPLPWWVMVLLLAHNPTGSPGAMSASADALYGALFLAGPHVVPEAPDAHVTADALDMLRTKPLVTALSALLPDPSVSMPAVLDLVLRQDVIGDPDVDTLRTFHRGELTVLDLQGRLPALSGWATYLLLVDDPCSTAALREHVRSVADDAMRASAPLEGEA